MPKLRQTTIPQGALVKRNGVGRGGWGLIEKIEVISTGKEYATKTSFETTKDDFEDEMILLKEMVVLNALKSHPHPNVVLFDGALALPRIGYAMPYYNMGSLFHDFYKTGNPRVTKLVDAYDIILGTSEGLTHLHHHGVAHLDIKSDNIALSEGASGRLVPVIIDFGLACRVSETQLGPQGNLNL